MCTFKSTIWRLEPYSLCGNTLLAGGMETIESEPKLWRCLTLLLFQKPTPTHDHEPWHGRMERLHIPYFPSASRTWQQFWSWWSWRELTGQGVGMWGPRWEGSFSWTVLGRAGGAVGSFFLALSIQTLTRRNIETVTVSTAGGNSKVAMEWFVALETTVRWLNTRPKLISSFGWNGKHFETWFLQQICVPDSATEAEPPL